jgi:phosphoribosylglycinamide formyltransferase 1
MAKIHIAVLASGKGSNLRAIFDAIEQGSLQHVALALVVSNNSASGALAFARSHDIPCVHLSSFKFDGDEGKLETAMLEELRKAKIDLIVLAGYMKKLPDAVVEAYPKRIINIHPALLPKYGGAGMYGSNVHSAVLAAGDKVTGATVHYVDKEYDSGDIIVQESCEVGPDDTPETLARRVREIEHRIYPKAIGMVAEAIRSSAERR